MFLWKWKENEKRSVFRIWERRLFSFLIWRTNQLKFNWFIFIDICILSLKISYVKAKKFWKVYFWNKIKQFGRNGNTLYIGNSLFLFLFKYIKCTSVVHRILFIYFLSLSPLCLLMFLHYCFMEKLNCMSCEGRIFLALFLFRLAK